MRVLKAAVLALLTAIYSAHGTIIVFSTDPATGRTAYDSSLNVLADGSQFLLGTFSNPNGISLLSSVAAIQTAGGWSEFIPLAGGNGATQRKSISSIGGTIPGKITGQAANNTAAATAFDNQPLYLMVFNTSSAASATQIGIFRATTGASPWSFPPNGNGVSDSRSINVDDTLAVAIGGVGSTSNAPSRFILSTMVPEPSAVGLVGCGILSLLGYRRLRRRS